MKKLTTLAIIWIILVSLMLGYIFHKESEQRNYIRNMTEPKLIQTNDLGCSLYQFKSDFYWTCPKELNINSIEQVSSKTKVLQPVINK